MRVLVYGASVVGTTFAACFAQAGVEVTILAQGERRRELEENGVKVTFGDGTVAEAKCPVTESLDPRENYDFVLVTVQTQQVAEVMPSLVASPVHNIVLLANTFTGFDWWLEKLGTRLLTGFPAFAGERSDEGTSVELLSWPLSRLQRTMFADETGGSHSDRLSILLGLCESAGLEVSATSTMRTWLRCHAAWVAPLSQAIYVHNGDRESLYRDRKTRRLMVEAIRDALAVAVADGGRVTPEWLQVFERMPYDAASVLGAVFRLPITERLLIEHPMSGRIEMDDLTTQIQEDAAARGMRTPFLDSLHKRARIGTL